MAKRQNNYPTLAAFLKKQREASGWSRKELCLKVGLSYPYYSELECGQRLPSEKALTVIAAAYDLEPDAFITERRIAAEKYAKRVKAEAKAITDKIEPTIVHTGSSADFRGPVREEPPALDLTGLDRHQIARLRVVAEAMRHGIAVTIDL